LVHLKEENKYLMFIQSKYGLEGERFATVGGLFNPGENASACAARELLEETGLEAERLVALGPPQGLRVQADRGGGLLHPFLARNCVPSSRLPASKSDDYERQRVRKLSLGDLEAVLLSGRVGEAQWLATTALGVLHERGALT
jgi:ADP-ribose pyrophosphatase YjhB (NUDIX family)